MATFETTFKTLGTNDSTYEEINAKFEYGQDFTGDGKNDIKVTLSIASTSNSGTEDMIGVAFETNGSVIPSGFTISPYTSVFGANQVSDGGSLDPGFNTSGGSSLEPYDVGIKFNEQGSGDGIVQTATFILSADTNLDAVALLDETNWWIRLQSTTGDGTELGKGSSKMVGFLDLPNGEEPPPSEPGIANTPGFWKNHSSSGWGAYGVSGYTPGGSFVDAFGLGSGYSIDFDTKLAGNQDTLLNALSAGGGGVNALARSGTAALLNAASDEAGSGINYIINDIDALKIGIAEVYGAGWTQVQFDSVLATLDIIDSNNDNRIGTTEVITAVKDAFGVISGPLTIGQVATAFDTMNNMPSLEVGQF